MGFRLASLLWLMLCVALAIGMYRYGYQVGHEDALNTRTFVGKTHARVYDVSEIISPAVTGSSAYDFDPLMRQFQSEVLPNTWDGNGGTATMAEFPTNLSLVISHDEDGHERIGKWLRQRREQEAKVAADNIAAAEAARIIDR